LEEGEHEDENGMTPTLVWCAAAVVVEAKEVEEYGIDEGCGCGCDEVWLLRGKQKKSRRRRRRKESRIFG